MTNGRSLIRSRWALAASAAVLLIGSLLLPSSVPQQTSAENSLSGAPAISSTTPFPRQMKRDHSNKPLHPSKPDIAVEDEDPLPEMEESDLPFIK